MSERNEVVREEFSAAETRQSTGTADAALAEQLRAQTEARFIMAMRRPRSINAVRVNILEDCKRYSFARSAWYKKPVGGKTIDGLGVRFAESAMRHMTNLHSEKIITYEDSAKRVLRVQVTDLESNICATQDIVIEKTVERSNVKPGQPVLAKRINAHGKAVYIVAATEADMANKAGSESSKVLRNLVLSMIPGDIKDEASEQIMDTLERAVHDDPKAQVKKMADGFNRINVRVADIEAYLGHPLETISPKEIVDMQSVFCAIRDGETTWHDLMKDRVAVAEPKAEAQPAPSSARDKIRAAADKVAAAAQSDDEHDAAFLAALKRAEARGKE